MLKLKELRKQKKVTQEEIASFLNVTQKCYSNYEKEKRGLGFELLIKLSNYFDVSIDYLVNNETNNLDLSPTEKQLIINFRKLSTEKQKALLTTSTIN